MLNIQNVQLKQTRVYQEIQEEVRREDWQAVILRQLRKKIGDASEVVQVQIEALTVEQLEVLSEALLNFQNLGDLEAWLEANE